MNRAKTGEPKTGLPVLRQILTHIIFGFKTLTIDILKSRKKFHHKLKTVKEFYEKESPFLMIGNPQTKIVKFVTRVRISWDQAPLHDL